MKRFVLLILIVLLASVFISCTKENNTTQNDPTEKKETVQESSNVETEVEDNAEKEKDIPSDKLEPKDFTLKDLEGNNVSLSDYKGKKIFLNFWASWCGPCQLEMPDFNEFYLEHKEDNFVILAVNIGEDQKTVEKFIEENEYELPILLDKDMKISKAYKVRGIPTTYIINESYEIVDIQVGAILSDKIQEIYDALE